jgi:biopolymer transport protein ExbD
VTEEQAANKPSAEPVFQPRRRRSLPTPPLTPLIDVFLFLIVFFLLSCQFHQSEGTIPANLPSTLAGANQGAPGIQVDPIRILLAPGGAESVMIEVGQGQQVEDMPALYTLLRERKLRYSSVGEQPVLIKPARGVRWGFVVDAFNQAVRAGYKEVGVAPAGGATAAAQGLPGV